ncbi:UNVERIFIED_ORG: putative membrane protein [Zoogloea ramigera]
MLNHTVNLWPLLGVAVIIVGFALRAHPVLVVVAACFVTGFAAAMDVPTLLATLGAAFIKTRNLPLILLLPLAAIGLLERYGLKEHAQASIARIKSATTGRLLIVYLAIREVSAAFGLTSIGGHPNMVRPLIAPMAEGAAEVRYPQLPDILRHRIRAMSAATDNVGLFFGEDVFVAFGAIVLMQTFLLGEGLNVDPLHIALWGIPTAVTAFIIHAWRLHRFDAQIARTMKRMAP